MLTGTLLTKKSLLRRILTIFIAYLFCCLASCFFVRNVWYRYSLKTLTGRIYQIIGSGYWDFPRLFLLNSRLEAPFNFEKMRHRAA